MPSQLTPDETLILLSADERGWIAVQPDPFGDSGDISQLLAAMAGKGYIQRNPAEAGDAFQLTMLGEYLRCGIRRKGRACKVDYRDQILREGIALADEIESMYYYHLENFPIGPTADRGLLKVRLFATTFAAAAYIMGRCAETPRDANEFTRECIAVAMRPQADRNSPSPAHQEASFADPLMSRILYLIREDFAEEPGAFEHHSHAFEQIVETYRQCLVEAVGEQSLPGELQRELERTVTAFVRRLFSVMDDLLDEVRQVNST